MTTMRTTALAFLMAAALIPLLPAAGAAEVRKDWLPDEIELQEQVGQTFELRVTTEHPVETFSVWAEFINTDTDRSFLVVLPELSKTVLSTDPEEAQWTATIPVDKKELTAGQYEVFLRAHGPGGTQAVYPSENEGIEFRVGDQHPEEPLMGGDMIVRVQDVPVVAYSAGGGAQAVHEGRVVVRSGEDLRLSIDTSNPDPETQAVREEIRFPDVFLQDVTWEVSYGQGVFSGEATLPGPQYALGPSALVPNPDPLAPPPEVEEDMEVRFRVYPRLLGHVGMTEVLLTNVTVDTTAPRLTDFAIEDAVIQDKEFTMRLETEDRLAHNVSVSFAGTAPGSQVRPGDGDVGVPLVPLPSALGFHDASGDRVLRSGDTLYLDADQSGNVTAGDVVLGGPAAGRVLNGTEPEIHQRLVLAAGPWQDAFLDVDGSEAYSLGDTVFLDDPVGTGEGVGVRGTGDLRISGGLAGKLVVGERASPAPLLPGSLGTFAFHDLNGNGVLDPDEPVYYAAGGEVQPLDVRVANPPAGLRFQSSTQAGNGVARGEHEFAVTLSSLGRAPFTIELRDEAGNTRTVHKELTVVPAHTQIKITHLVVLNQTVLPRENVHFGLTVNQTEGVLPMPVTATFAADGVLQGTDLLLPATGAQFVEYDNAFRTGRHTMNVTVQPPPGVEVLPGSVLTREVDFEVFLGAVDHGEDRYYVRANARGLAGSAVLHPGLTEQVYDMEPRQQGDRQIYAFEAEGVALFWDPFARDADNRAVTTIPVGTEEPDGEESPAAGVLVAAVLLATLAAVVRRRR